LVLAACTTEGAERGDLGELLSPGGGSEFAPDATVVAQQDPIELGQDAFRHPLRAAAEVPGPLPLFETLNDEWGRR
jgi:hypothetical protein